MKELGLCTQSLLKIPTKSDDLMHILVCITCSPPPPPPPPVIHIVPVGTYVDHTEEGVSDSAPDELCIVGYEVIGCST